MASNLGPGSSPGPSPRGIHPSDVRRPRDPYRTRPVICRIPGPGGRIWTLVPPGTTAPRIRLGRSRRRHPLARRLLAPAALLVALSACTFGAPPGATDQGRDISGLYQLMFWIAIGV